MYTKQKLMKYKPNDKKKTKLGFVKKATMSCEHIFDKKGLLRFERNKCCENVFWSPEEQKKKKKKKKKKKNIVLLCFTCLKPGF